MASSGRMSDFLNMAVSSHNSSGNLNSVDYFWDGVKLVMQPTNLLDPYDGVTLDHNLWGILLTPYWITWYKQGVPNKVPDKVNAASQSEVKY